MGTMAAVGLTRLHFKGKGAYRGLLLLPIIIPEIAMAVAALILFIAIGVPLGLATIVVSHIVFCVAYVTLTVMGRMEGLDPRLEEAAQDLGASPLSAFFRVTLPLLAPGIVAGALLAFVLSLDDFVITQFTAGVGSTTLPLRIFQYGQIRCQPGDQCFEYSDDSCYRFNYIDCRNSAPAQSLNKRLKKILGALDKISITSFDLEVTFPRS